MVIQHPYISCCQGVRRAHTLDRRLVSKGMRSYREIDERRSNTVKESKSRERERERERETDERG